MIIRAELPELERHISPRPYRVPIIRPFAAADDPLSDPSRPVKTVSLVFTPETDNNIYGPDVYVKWDEIPYRWSCQDCYAAYGDKRHVFATDWIQVKHMKQGEPSYQQQQQMNEHAHQHQIIWAWVRGLE